ncbi:MAG TPA: ribonuclease R, partial [Xanthobacteraceae bacterium]
LGDVVEVRLVEAAPVAGALRFELLSEGQVQPRNRKRGHFGDAARPKGKHKAKAKPEAGRHRPKKARKPGKIKPGKSKKAKR